MTMRTPGDTPLIGLSGAFIDDLLAHSRPVPPPPNIPGERVGTEIAELRSRLAHSDRYGAEELTAMRGDLVRLYDERDAEEGMPLGE